MAFTFPAEGGGTEVKDAPGEDLGGLYWLHLQPPLAAFFFFCRSTMTTERLSGLALKFNRRECELLQKTPSRMRDLVNKFNQLHPRRMNLPFLLADQP